MTDLNKNTKIKKTQKNSTKASTTKSKSWINKIGKAMLDTLNAQSK
ncbi:MAG: hypothetical protein WC895_02130 [Candidatus Shapirobacteria bacterium]|jgi:hypothetical protein